MEGAAVGQPDEGERGAGGGGNHVTQRPPMEGGSWGERERRADDATNDISALLLLAREGEGRGGGQRVDKQKKESHYQ